MTANDLPPSYEAATGIASSTFVAFPDEQQQTQQQQQQQSQQQPSRIAQICYPLVRTSREVKSMRYSKIGLAILIFFCFCGALAMIVYFCVDD